MALCCDILAISLAIFVKNLTDKTDVFNRKAKDKNALIVNFDVRVKP